MKLCKKQIEDNSCEQTKRTSMNLLTLSLQICFWVNGKWNSVSLDMAKLICCRGFTILNKNKSNIDDAVSLLNKRFLTIKFAVEIENKVELPFFDILVDITMFYFLDIQ